MKALGIFVVTLIVGLALALVVGIAGAVLALCWSVIRWAV